MSVNNDSIIELKSLHKQFGELRVIQDLNLNVRKGERHALIGPNGAGKSTVFSLISGLLAPTSGEIIFKGEGIGGLAPHLISRKGLGRSFQITNIFPNLSVFENIRIGILGRFGIRYGLNRRVANISHVNDEAMELTKSVNLLDKAEVPAAVLSYSEQRALEIGLTLTTNPDVILLDEPTAGMSREETKETIDLIMSVTDGRTLLMVEHDMDVVFKMCDRISVLVYGNILASDTPEAIKNNAKVQEAYLGEHAE
jgi:branched-chain amino acid transport system ATP-binding protein